MALSEEFQSYVREQAARYGIPERLAFSLITQESDGKQSAVSPKGATGIMQLMPATAKELGVDMNDPYENVEGGLRYLSEQYDRFGSWPLALAAYNAGPGAVEKYNGIPPYEETQNYVPAILARAGMTGTLLASEEIAARRQLKNKENLDYLSDALQYLDLSKLMGAPKVTRDLGARINPGRQGSGARALQRLGIASLV